MSKILASKDHDRDKDRKSLNKLRLLGGALGLSLLALVLVFILIK